jgi:hypothetical protein
MEVVARMTHAVEEIICSTRVTPIPREDVHIRRLRHDLSFRIAHTHRPPSLVEQL